MHAPMNFSSTTTTTKNLKWERENAFASLFTFLELTSHAFHSVTYIKLQLQYTCM